MAQKKRFVSREMDFRLLQWIGIIALMLALSACGGGGSGAEDGAGTNTTSTNPGGGSTGTNPTGGNGGDTNTAPPAPTGTPVNNEQLFATTVHPIITSSSYLCVACHAAAVSPFMASSNVTTAYNAVWGFDKVDLSNPANSRLVVKLRGGPNDVGGHNCQGPVACEALATEFENAIQSWADAVADSNAPPVDNGVRVTSMVTSFANAQEAVNQRVDNNVIAKYDFNEGTGDIVRDVSGVGTPMDLLIEGDMEWVNGGLQNINGKAKASATASRKLFDMISEDQDEYTIEAWIIPGALDQDAGGISTIIAYQNTPSGSTNNTNFTMGQVGTYFELRNRTVDNGNNGRPALTTNGADVRDNLMHVVFTIDQTSGRKIFVDGQFFGYMDGTPAGQFNWNENFGFTIGNEYEDESGNLWLGTFRMVAIHNRALNDAQVQQNFEAGLGNFTTLAFDVSDIVGAPASIQMLASEMDDNAYVFAKPTFMTDVPGVAVKNIRVAVNNDVPVATQAFRSVDATVLQSGQELSPLGAVIPKDMGPEMDMFHLEFEVLGSQMGTGDIPIADQEPGIIDLGILPDLGVRSFSSVNNTMSALTGIPVTRNDIRNRYQELRDQLPATADMLAFSSATQIAIQRLAVTYCGEVLEVNSACNSVFGNCSIGSAAEKVSVANALFDNFVGELDVQPDRADVTGAVVGMIDGLGCANGCSGALEQTVLQASCAAVLSSGAMTIN